VVCDGTLPPAYLNRPYYHFLKTNEETIMFKNTLILTTALMTLIHANQESNHHSNTMDVEINTNNNTINSIEQLPAQDTNLTGNKRKLTSPITHSNSNSDSNSDNDNNNNTNNNIENSNKRNRSHGFSSPTFDKRNSIIQRFASYNNSMRQKSQIEPEVYRKIQSTIAKKMNAVQFESDINKLIDDNRNTETMGGKRFIDIPSIDPLSRDTERQPLENNIVTSFPASANYGKEYKGLAVNSITKKPIQKMNVPAPDQLFPLVPHSMDNIQHNPNAMVDDQNAHNNNVLAHESNMNNVIQNSLIVPISNEAMNNDHTNSNPNPLPPIVVPNELKDDDDIPLLEQFNNNPILIKSENNFDGHDSDDDIYDNSMNARVRPLSPVVQLLPANEPLMQNNSNHHLINTTIETNNNSNTIPPLESNSIKDFHIGRSQQAALLGSLENLTHLRPINFSSINSNNSNEPNAVQLIPSNHNNWVPNINNVNVPVSSDVQMVPQNQIANNFASPIAINNVSHEPIVNCARMGDAPQVLSGNAIYDAVLSWPNLMNLKPSTIPCGYILNGTGLNKPIDPIAIQQFMKSVNKSQKFRLEEFDHVGTLDHFINCFNQFNDLKIFSVQFNDLSDQSQKTLINIVKKLNYFSFSDVLTSPSANRVQFILDLMNAYIPTKNTPDRLINGIDCSYHGSCEVSIWETLNQSLSMMDDKQYQSITNLVLRNNNLFSGHHYSLSPEEQNKLNTAQHTFFKDHLSHFKNIKSFQFYNVKSPIVMGAFLNTLKNNVPLKNSLSKIIIIDSELADEDGIHLFNIINSCPNLTKIHLTRNSLTSSNLNNWKTVLPNAKYKNNLTHLIVDGNTELGWSGTRQLINDIVKPNFPNLKGLQAKNTGLVNPPPNCMVEHLIVQNKFQLITQ
jgi:hypothetical protein